MTLAAKRGSWKEASSQPGHPAALWSAARAEGGGLRAPRPGAPRPPQRPPVCCGQTQTGRQTSEATTVSLHALCLRCDVSECHVTRVAGGLPGATGLRKCVQVGQTQPCTG